LQEEYTVYFRGSSVGTVRVRKQDLFYHIRCQCHPKMPGMHRLIAKTEKGQTDLGICVPMDGAFGVETRISCKRFGEGKPEFWISPVTEDRKGLFYPVDPNMPFSEISKLRNGYFAIENGQKGVILGDSEGKT